MLSGTVCSALSLIYTLLVCSCLDKSIRQIMHDLNCIIFYNQGTITSLRKKAVYIAAFRQVIFYYEYHIKKSVMCTSYFERVYVSFSHFTGVTNSFRFREG